jgi:XTP/dITP diphosphohydrolase
MNRKILVATTNEGKVREIRAVMEDLPIEWSFLADCPTVAAPVEDAITFEANAILKARYYAKEFDAIVLADDSGLEVDALDGAPGVQSARFSDEGTDTANNLKLIAALRSIPQARRTARFVCCLALVQEDDVLLTSMGSIEGQIVDDPRGTNGFGYDPHFFVPDLGMTMAEMPLGQKNALSHRGKALASIKGGLATLWPA